MSLNARKLREDRKKRLAARKTAVKADEMPPEMLEEQIPAEGEEEIEEETAGEGDPADMPPADLPEGGELPADAQPEEEEEAEGEGDEVLPPVPAEEEMPMATSAFRYNPIYQKPTHLGMDKPSSGYHYYGPPPDAGTSYGFYVDADNDVGIIAPVAKGKSSIFSPVSGKAMRLQGKLDTDALATVLAMASDMTKVMLGKETRMTTVALAKATGKVFDAMTGKQIKIEADGEGLPAPAPMPAQVPVAPMAAEEEEEEKAEGEEEDETKADDMPVDLPPAEEPAAGELPMTAKEALEEEKAEGEEKKEEVEAVEYEALSSVDAFEGETLTQADVHMTLFDEESAPYWNIDIKGSPVARVNLKDQPKPDEIREVFCSADYFKGVSDAISRVGLKPVLVQIKAHAWANKVEKTKLAMDIRAKVNAEAQAQVVATTKNLMRNLLNCTAVVCAGMDKNFYKEVGNPLKEALWSELYSYGITNPAPIIEAAFRKGSTKYFETVLSKAVEYMELEPKALEQIKKAIGEADVLPPEGNTGDVLPEGFTAPEDAPTLSQRLAASSVAVAGIPALAGDAFGDHKKSLRRELRLGGAGPRQR